MAPIIILKDPPALDPAWLAHERTANLLAPKPITTDPTERQRIYSETCKARNTSLLSNQDKALNDGIFLQDSFIEALKENHSIPIRCYSSNSPHDPESKAAQNTIIYYHGGGLTVGDLDSEDLSCRRISKTLQCTVYSIAYRLMPQHSADDALADALTAFRHISQTPQLTNGKLVLVGSSSGGQLAAQVSQLARRGNGKSGESTCRVDGVLLRCPVTCDAANLPARFRDAHVSMDVAFHTSLLSAPALTVENRTVEKLPLEEEGLRGLPRHWVQVCTNDVYYSDGVCYVEALREQGVDVRVDMVVGWPHTFWLKAPRLERAVEAERDMVEGLRWLLEG